MAYLKGTTEPDSTVQASIGDIYTDTATGQRYKCEFAIRIGDDDDEFSTTWRKLDGKSLSKPVTEKSKNTESTNTSNKHEINRN